mgnify:FL=1|jgi:hypothetical protein|tara:strand:- start:245 stop:805 length:561 start_codon:yes stop_codon:yes gene_type:complete
MANWYNDQVTNKNFLSPIGFIFILDKARKVSFLCQKAEIPELSLSSIDIPTKGFAPIPIGGNTINYGDLNLEFIVDEDLKNYMEIHNWIRALGTPSDFTERKEWNESNRSDNRSKERNTKWSDATLQVLNNNNLVNFDVVFQSVFPVSLSTLPFDVTGTDNDYFTATATFRYTLYEVREKNSQTRR